MAWLDENSTEGPSEDVYFAFTYLIGTANPAAHIECHSDGSNHAGHDHGDELPEGVTEEDIASALEDEGIDTSAFGRRLQSMTEEEWHDEFGVNYNLDTEACQDAIAFAEELAFNYMGFQIDFNKNHPILSARCTGAADFSTGCEAAKRAYRKEYLAKIMDLLKDRRTGAYSN